MTAEGSGAAPEREAAPKHGSQLGDAERSKAAGNEAFRRRVNSWRVPLPTPAAGPPAPVPARL